MNKNFILLLLLVIFAGCTGVQSDLNMSDVNSVGVDDTLLKDETIKLPEQIPTEKAEEPVKVEEVVKKVPVKEPVKILEEPVKVAQKVEEVDKKTNIQLYKHPFVLNGKNTNIQMYNTLEELEENDFKIGITKEELLDTETFDFIFNSKPSSNGAVAKVSGRLYPILSIVYKFPMEAMENIVYSDELTCEDSTLDRKLVMFDSDYTSNEVLFDSETGCIQFKTTSQGLMGTLGDKFFYELFSE